MEPEWVTKKDDNSILFEVSINHPCWFCDVTEKNRDAILISTMSSIHEDSITNIVQLTSSTPEKDIEFIRNHKLVKKVDVLLLNINGALLKVISSYKAMTYNILHQTDVMLLESPTTADGNDSEILLAKSHKSMNELLSRWKEQEGYEVRLKKKKHFKTDDANGYGVFSKSGFFDLKSAKELLSGKQLDIFRLAGDYGYYEMPKRITIEELAEKVDLAPSTVAEHLRKAEMKLLPVLSKVLRKI